MNIQAEAPLTDISDEELALLARSGNPSAFAVLSERYMPVVKNRAMRYSNVVGVDTEDFVQEGMLALFKAVKGFDECTGNPFRAYAVVCINNSMATAIKAHMKVLTQTTPVGTSESEITPPEHPKHMLVEDMFIEQEDSAFLAGQIRSVLSNFERQVLKLYLGGYSYLQVSKLLCRSTKAVDNALQRVRRKLRSKL